MESVDNLGFDQAEQPLDYDSYGANSTDALGNVLMMVAAPVLVGSGVFINVYNSTTEQSPVVYTLGFSVSVLAGLVWTTGFALKQR